MDDLKAFLSSAAGQHISRVYLNNKNEWLFASRPGFEKVLTREEVLASGAKPPQAAQQAGQTTKQANVPTVIEPVKKYETQPDGLSRPKHSNRF
jgi:hypothetical protein